MRAPTIAEFMSLTVFDHLVVPGGPKRASLVVNDNNVVSMEAKKDVCDPQFDTAFMRVQIDSTHNDTDELQPVQPQLHDVHDRLAFRVIIRVPTIGCSLQHRFLSLLLALLAPGA